MVSSGLQRDIKEQYPREQDRPTPSYWIVVCPEPHVRGGVWVLWYRENCVAVGWPPPNWTLNGPSEDSGWAYGRNRLKEIRPGDKVIPFLLNWRVGPVGVVREVRVADTEWSQTVENYSGSIGSDLGRRILVSWENTGMPPNGKCSLVPLGKRPSGPLSRHTIDKLSAETFQGLCSVLSDPSSWIDVVPPGIASAGGRLANVEPASESEIEMPHAVPPAELALLERDLQKFLSRDLGVIEPGLVSDPAYQLEEYTSDVGRMDLLCKDAHDNWVVIELKADAAWDDAVGQIVGYMSWVRDNLPNGSTVRGIIVCKNTTPRVKSAIKLVHGLSIKRYTLNCSIDEMS